ncbi:hypothetical protein [Sutcliffiella cohnii]|uniref:hypothetical protein n=1 Tax=Sutcliffiella cohnii TaxID=33932 RepID=UPI002E1C0BDA|nr:hypothetical protein [Sutcliffiella cohnii]
MNKLTKLLGASALAAMVLAGCGTDNQDVPPPEEQAPTEVPQDDTGLEQPGTGDQGTDGGGMEGQDDRTTPEEELPMDEDEDEEENQ